MKRFKIDPEAQPRAGADWAAFDALSDADSEERAASDPDALPRTERELAQAQRFRNISTFLRTSQADLDALMEFVIRVWEDVARLEKISAPLSASEKKLKSWATLIDAAGSISNFEEQARQLSALVQQARNATVHLEVRPALRGWIVRKSGSEAPASSYRTKQEALSIGRRLARRQHCDLFVYAADGEFQRRYHFGSAAV